MGALKFAPLRRQKDPLTGELKYPLWMTIAGLAVGCSLIWEGAAWAWRHPVWFMLGWAGYSAMGALYVVCLRQKRYEEAERLMDLDLYAAARRVHRTAWIRTFLGWPLFVIQFLAAAARFAVKGRP